MGAIEAVLGEPMNVLLLSDPELARRAVLRVVAWDRATPDPALNARVARESPAREKLIQIDQAMTSLPARLSSDPTRMAEARAALPSIEARIKRAATDRCAAGILDGPGREAALVELRRRVVQFVDAHPDVKRLTQGRFTGGAISTSVTYRDAQLPGRAIVSMRTADAQEFLRADVEMTWTITSDRKLGTTSFQLVCLSDKEPPARKQGETTRCAGDLRGSR
jgi:hypothetical protein